MLRDVGFNLAGNFSCEVTLDAPSFSNRFVSEQMDVIGKYIKYIDYVIIYELEVLMRKLAII